MTLHSAAATLPLLKEGLPAAIKAADIDGQVEDKIFAGKFQMRLITYLYIYFFLMGPKKI